ncbi:MAG: lipoate--protein ligase [Treponema sp.]|nr:lipoate--protein ligase [Treponema sp.]
MFFYIGNDRTSPYFNLALEQAVFDSLDRRRSYCMLWQNSSAVIVGRHQNTAAEINPAFVDSRGISVVRRLSGGGAVYHDLGNVNFTFITGIETEEGLNFSVFCKPVLEALLSFGVRAEISGRNDITIEGKKISGNAQYIRQGRVLHHGTLLYDTDLSVLEKALTANGKIESKGIKSVRSGITNIRPYMKKDMPVEAFKAALKESLFSSFSMGEYELGVEELNAAKTLEEQVYSKWDWNYGKSPPYNVRKSRRVEGCGTVEVLLYVGDGGMISGTSFYGDFFGSEDPAALAALLTGRRLERGELSSVLQDAGVSRFFHNMETETFLSLLID